MASEETNALTIFEMKIRGERRTLKNNNKEETKDILQGKDPVTFIKFPRLRWCDHVKRMQNQEMPKQNVSAPMEGTNKEKSKTR
jgi:hypothetical protein